MAATILVRDVFKQASTLLQDTDPQFQRQPESEMVDFLNDGALFVASLLPMANARIDTIKLQPGTLQSIDTVQAADVIPGDGVPLEGALQGIQVLRVLCNMGSTGLVAGKAIRVVPAELKDAMNLSWRGMVGSNSIDQVCIDPGTPKHFENYPAVQGPTWARIAWNVQPRRLTYTGTVEVPQYGMNGSNTTRIPLSDEYANVLVNWIVARSNMRETEWADRNKGDYFASMVLNWLNAKVAAITGTNPNLKMLPFQPQPVGQAA